MRIFQEPIEFEWDAGNRDKSQVKHRVANEECEEVFFDPHKRFLREGIQCGEEVRHILLGRTFVGRALFIVFTMRRSKVRVISARDLNRKERLFYEKTHKNSEI